MDMAKIKLSAGFSILPEGTHVLKITSVDYKEAFGKLEIHMENQKGQKHTERFSIIRADGSVNDGALGAFSFFAKTAMNDFDLEEIDHDDLVGRFMECEVTHEKVPNKNDPSKTLTFTRLGDKRPSDGWGEAATENKVDLMAMLNS